VFTKDELLRDVWGVQVDGEEQRQGIQHCPGAAARNEDGRPGRRPCLPT
jgi:hypothetical protein